MPDATNSVLLARYLSGECPDAEREQVEVWMGARPERRRLMDRLAATWQTGEDPLPATDVDRMWQDFARRAGLDPAPAASSRRRRGGYLLRYAAVLVAAVGLSYLVFAGSDPGDQLVVTPIAAAPTTVTVDTGQRARVVLSDGTVVTLDAGSRLTYPERFPANAREVSLEGEGYFEVRADPDRPFVVRARDARVQVLGTRFNIRAWERSRRVQVAVVEGRVSLGALESDAGEEVVVAAGQGSVVPDGAAPATPRAVEVEGYLDWMRDELAYDDTPLGEVMDRLERWHGVRFVLEDSSVARERVTAHLASRELGDALELISALTGLVCEREGAVVRLASR